MLRDQKEINGQVFTQENPIQVQHPLSANTKCLSLNVKIGRIIESSKQKTGSLLKNLSGMRVAF